MGFFQKLRKTIQRIVLLFFGSTILFVCLYKYVPVYATPLMMLRVVQQAWRGEHIRLKHHWVPLEEISQHLATAVMCTEDAKFLEHRGFDFAQIGEALQASHNGRGARGASTISQQTAKNVFLWPGRSWVRKGLEAYFTLLIETVWGKRRIMEVYLNSIEMGDGIYGAEAVAQLHFGCTAHQLTRRHCALIAISLPNPLTRNSAQPTRAMLRRQTKLIAEMRWVERTQALGNLNTFSKPNPSK